MRAAIRTRGLVLYVLAGVVALGLIRTVVAVAVWAGGGS